MPSDRVPVGSCAVSLLDASDAIITKTAERLQYYGSIQLQCKQTVDNADTVEGLITGCLAGTLPNGKAVRKSTTNEQTEKYLNPNKSGPTGI